MNLCYCNKTINDVYYQGCPVNTIYYQDTKVYEKPKGCFEICIGNSGISQSCRTSAAFCVYNTLNYSVAFCNLTNRPLYLSAVTTSCVGNNVLDTCEVGRACTWVGWGERACTWVGWGGGACRSNSQSICMTRYAGNYATKCISNCLIQPGRCLKFFEYAFTCDCRCATNFNIYFGKECYASDNALKLTCIRDGWWNNRSIDKNFSVWIYNDVYVDASGYEILSISLTDENGKVLFCEPYGLSCSWCCTGFITKTGCDGCWCKNCCYDSVKCGINCYTYSIPSVGGVMACAIKCVTVFHY